MLCYACKHNRGGFQLFYWRVLNPWHAGQIQPSTLCHAAHGTPCRPQPWALNQVWGPIPAGTGAVWGPIQPVDWPRITHLAHETQKDATIQVSVTHLSECYSHLIHFKPHYRNTPFLYLTHQQISVCVWRGKGGKRERRVAPPVHHPTVSCEETVLLPYTHKNLFSF